MMAPLQNKSKVYRESYKKYKESCERFAEIAELDIENCDLLTQEGFVQRFRVLLHSTIDFMELYMKKQGDETGYGDPKDLIRYAYSFGYVKDGQVWIDAFEYLANLALEFNESLLKEVVSFLKNYFYDQVRYFNTQLQENVAA